jgi:hypothetical protein
MSRRLRQLVDEVRALWKYPVTDREILKELKRQMTPRMRKINRARLRAKARGRVT